MGRVSWRSTNISASPRNKKRWEKSPSASSPNHGTDMCQAKATNTNDTEACVQQAEEIIKAGGELVRFTTQGSREAENMKNINAGIRADGAALVIIAAACIQCGYGPQKKYPATTACSNYRVKCIRLNI